MALETAQWGAVAGVFVIIAAMMVYNQMVAKRQAAAATSSQRSDSGIGEHLSRFVVHDGDVVGEVVARDGDRLVVKHQGVFRAIPVAQTRVANDEVHVQGDLDWDAATEHGQDWLQRNRKGQDDAVSRQLTTSSDVKRPAFEAFQQRTADSEEEE